MERIYPLKEDVISRFRGMLVCVVFKNGFRQIGVLESCHNGMLELNESPFGFGRRHSAEYMDDRLEKQAQPTSTATPQKPAGSRKNKKAKAAGLSKTNHSPNNYAPHLDNPASADPHIKGVGNVKLPLNDIALLFLMI